MSKEDILSNLYKVWGSSPLEHLFNHESVQFYSDLCLEGITSDEYMAYARKQDKKVSKLKPIGTKFKKFGKTWEIYYSDVKLKEYKCICKDKKIHEFRDFKESELEGVEVINGI